MLNRSINLLQFSPFTSQSIPLTNPSTSTTHRIVKLARRLEKELGKGKAHEIIFDVMV